MTGLSKEYVEKQHELAAMNYRAAVKQQDRQDAQDYMARLQKIAMEDFGFAYADELHSKYIAPLMK